MYTRFYSRFHEPDDDPPIFDGFQATLETEATLAVKGREIDVALKFEVYGTNSGDDVLPDHVVLVTGRNGGQRVICAPFHTGRSSRERGAKGFTAELSDAVGRWIEDNYDSIREWAKDRVS